MTGPETFDPELRSLIEEVTRSVRPVRPRHPVNAGPTRDTIRDWTAPEDLRRYERLYEDDQA